MEGIVKGRTAGPRRTLIYGKPGVGKSTLAAGAPGVIFIQTERGLEDIGAERWPLSQSFDDLLGRFGQLAQDKHSYKTVAVDSLDGLEGLINAEVCQSEGVNTIADLSYGKGYAMAVNYWRKAIDCLEYLQLERGMWVILLAHEALLKIEDPEHGNYDRWALRIDKRAAGLVTDWVDEVLFAQFKMHVLSDKKDFGQKKGRAIGTGERIVKATERPTHLAKNRLDLPDEMPLPKVGGWLGVYGKYLNGAAGAVPATEKKATKGKKESA